ncbi:MULTISPECIES: DUF3540 domain-containing protein [unclassified Bosea (in: a-proteobacteria)]|uniref:DUF3540 domain-containing protein n=1 Tax=unclassified Bosea (in: a-proteobacteria) TaxID=2653178 RepID=UPI000F754B4E|nr:MULTISPECIES: DUF3540 domain-containing protein [unclassified Bosea (in: a-proteobacteria)]AZO78255.1 hypothetical protein BLM15_12010 [Bosea sp. Tri-49]RXT20258.1 hypothetical protein B5U98_20005 [Bosea sp. Tri-39]RXT37130.1 hypothetical protein B5U99_14320 [Bosea sp. Tri-54]
MMPAATALISPPGAMPALRPATVVARTGDRLLLRSETGEVPACVALSCPLAPHVGDEVLAWAGGEEWHVLAVLGRSAHPEQHVRPNGLEGVIDGEAKPLPPVPHYEDASVTEGEAAAGRPYTRIDVPLKPDEFGSGTYLRLGAYVEGEEGAMMPELSLSKSTASNTTKTEPSPDLSLTALLSGKNPFVTMAETANEAKASDATNADGSVKQGYLKRGDKFVKNKAGQMELLTISTKAKTTTSSGDGFLGKTDSDVNLSVGGGMLVDIVKGQTTNVSDGDIKFTAPAGVFAVNALSGVSITAGTPDAPANISLLAYGYVKNEAKGPLSEWLYSTSEKKTYGTAKEWFYGEKYTEFRGYEEKKFLGVSVSYFLGDQISTNLAARINLTMAATLTLALGTEFRLNAAIDLKINLAIDMNIIIGVAFKNVIGADTKVVLGSDLKYVSGLDFKWVGVDGKSFGLELKNANMSAYFNAVLARSGTVDIDNKATKVGTGFFFRS